MEQRFILIFVGVYVFTVVLMLLAVIASRGTRFRRLAVVSFELLGSVALVFTGYNSRWGVLHYAVTRGLVCGWLSANLAMGVGWLYSLIRNRCR